MNPLRIALNGIAIEVDADDHQHKAGERHLVIGSDGVLRIEVLAEHKWSGRRPFADRTVIIDSPPPAGAMAAFVAVPSLGRVIKG